MDRSAGVCPDAGGPGDRRRANTTIVDFRQDTGHRRMTIKGHHARQRVSMACWPGNSIKSTNDTHMHCQTPKLRDLHAPAKHLHLPVDYADGPQGGGGGFAASAGGG